MDDIDVDLDARIHSQIQDAIQLFQDSFARESEDNVTANPVYYEYDGNPFNAKTQNIPDSNIQNPEFDSNAMEIDDDQDEEEQGNIMNR